MKILLFLFISCFFTIAFGQNSAEELRGGNGEGRSQSRSEDHPQSSVLRRCLQARRAKDDRTGTRCARGRGTALLRQSRQRHPVC